MNRALIATLLAGAALLTWAGLSPAPGRQAAGAPALPPFPTADPALWINSDPLRPEDLRDRVVVLSVWTVG